jgi:retron-type reverse transcriptase
MITHNRLYEQICSFENLLWAGRRAERGKRMQDTIGRFRTDLEAELLRLRRALLDKTYAPGPYRETIITRPKRRMISAAPFRDRVVHHAVCNVVMPLFERKMIFDLYSNRVGKGTHAAIRRAQEYCGQFDYVLKCDVRKFFPSMDHAVLKEIIRKTIACRETLWLLDRLIDGSNRQEPVWQVFPGDDLATAAERRVGLPIGNLTSQWFGGVYLAEFDHWVKETLRCPGYVRYVDDFLLFGDDRAQLADWRGAISRRLTDYRLRLNERKSRSFPTGDGVTYLGQRVWPGRRRLCRQNVADARRRLRWNVRQYKCGNLSKDALLCRWNSWRGHAEQADCGALVEKVKRELRNALGATGT